MRKKYLDILRLIALFYMFFQHSALILLKPVDNNKLTNFLFEIVPFCSALFLFVAGFSLTISNSKYVSKKDFILRLILRGLILIICSSILFIIENGFQFPDFVFSSGILNTIGIFIILSIGIFIFDNKNIQIIIGSSITIILTIITIYLDVKNIYIYPFNYAYESISPTIIFGFMGISIGLIINNKNNKIGYITSFILLIIGLVIITISTFKYGFLKGFSFDNGRYIVERIYNTEYLLFDFKKLFIQETFYASTWNFNTTSFVLAIGTTFFLFGLLFFIEPIFKNINYKIIMPAKYAFINYFFHFIVIAIVVLNYGENIFNKIQFYIFLFILYLLSIIFSNYIEYKKNKNFI